MGRTVIDINIVYGITDPDAQLGTIDNSSSAAKASSNSNMR